MLEYDFDLYVIIFKQAEQTSIKCYLNISSPHLISLIVLTTVRIASIATLLLSRHDSVLTVPQATNASYAAWESLPYIFHSDEKLSIMIYIQLVIPNEYAETECILYLDQYRGDTSHEHRRITPYMILMMKSICIRDEKINFNVYVVERTIFQKLHYSPGDFSPRILNLISYGNQ